MTWVKDASGVLCESPVHGAFGLSYASYLVWPRVLMEAMPYEWQERFVALAKEFNAAFEHYEPPRGWRVQAVNACGRFQSDPLAEYRRPDAALVASMRREELR